MKAIKPYVIVYEGELDRNKLKMLELAARVCYKSEDKITPDSAGPFLLDKIKRDHMSLIEHEKVTVKFVVDRGISHEIVRHRLASYSQESTRYVNYAKGKYGSEITTIDPFGIQLMDSEAYLIWEDTQNRVEKAYMRLIELGVPAQWARSVLTNSTKTEVVTTYNLREWRHFFYKRADAAAHPQMRQVVIPLLLEFQKVLPELYSDIEYDKDFNPANYADVIYQKTYAE